MGESTVTRKGNERAVKVSLLKESIAKRVDRYS